MYGQLKRSLHSLIHPLNHAGEQVLLAINSFKPDWWQDNGVLLLPIVQDYVKY